MQPAYTWIIYVSMTVYGLLYLVALAVSWLGWRRKRHIGYFVIAIWALAMLINIFMARILATVVMNSMSPFVSKLFLGTDANVMMMMGGMVTNALPFLLLLAGLALLVFRENPPPAPRDPSA